jgi:hypothetical protein
LLILRSNTSYRLPTMLHERISLFPSERQTAIFFTTELHWCFARHVRCQKS